MMVVPAVVTTTASTIDLSEFPIDKQSFVLRFGSWIYDGMKMDMQLLHGMEHADLSQYEPSVEWDLISESLGKFAAGGWWGQKK